MAFQPMMQPPSISSVGSSPGITSLPALEYARAFLREYRKFKGLPVESDKPQGLEVKILSIMGTRKTVVYCSLVVMATISGMIFGHFFG